MEGKTSDILEFKNVSVTVKNGKRLLSDISFSIERGSFNLLIGKNGSGKSTLADTLIGIRKYSGDIFLKGKNIKHYKAMERARLLSALPQMLPSTSLTVRELALLGRNPHMGCFGYPSREDRAAADEAMRRVSISGFCDRTLSSLSGGERQRAFIAAMLSTEAEILVLDEPGAFLDASAVRELYALLAELVKNEKKTVLAVLHDLSGGFFSADNAILLSGGRLIEQGETADERLLAAVEKEFSLSRYVGKNGTEERIFFA